MYAATDAATGARVAVKVVAADCAGGSGSTLAAEVEVLRGVAPHAAVVGHIVRGRTGGCGWCCLGLH